MNELEKSHSKLYEETDESITTVSEYTVCSKRLAGKVVKEEAKSTMEIQEVKQLQVNVQ